MVKKYHVFTDWGPEQLEELNFGQLVSKGRASGLLKQCFIARIADCSAMRSTRHTVEACRTSRDRSSRAKQSRWAPNILESTTAKVSRRGSMRPWDAGSNCAAVRGSLEWPG